METRGAGEQADRPGTGVGVVVPYDFALDREMWRWVPESSSLYVTRTPHVTSPADADQAMLISAPEIVDRAVRDVLLPEPGVVAYSCTSGSFVCGSGGEWALRDTMLAAGAPQAVTTAGSLVRACGHLGVRRLALATPYVDDLTARLEAFLGEHGIGTAGRHGLGLLGRIWETTPADVVAAVRAADHPDADAVFVSCTNLPTYDLIGDLENELGKPVLAANQVTMWAALGAMGVAAVGPGQSLIESRTPGRRPTLHVVPETPAEITGGDDGDPSGTSPPVLHKVRVRLPDESGALARLTAAVAEVGGNILSLAVHGSDPRSVIDEMLVAGPVSATRLTRVIRRRLPAAGHDAVRVVEADPHELVDAPARALDLVARSGTADDARRGLTALLDADDTVFDTGPPDAADAYALGVRAPGGGWWVARRAWAPFTVTERARAEAFVRVTAPQPGPATHELVLPGGEELVAAPSSGDEVVELDVLLRTCLSGEPDDLVVDWTAADLREVLVPAGGRCLAARTVAGDLVAVASVGPGPGDGSDGGDPVGDPVVLVHPLYRGMRVGRWLRRRLGADVAVG
ncbi:hypothetical protein ACLE50_12050 [Pseudonocardia sp. 1LY6.1]|uniref:aspartate racemase/maleate isomerase family protein n=1 Tax=Pseudonocardia phyllosphaerae TaxID=3390502 RepID=UPI00397A353C